MENKGINDGWNKLVTKYSAVKAVVWGKLAPYLNPILAKIQPYWQPVRDKYAAWTEPIRVWHRQMKAKNPMLGNAIQWSYDVMRYGFYFLFGLIFCSWIGIFGHMPDSDELRNIENSNSTEIYSADSVLIGKFYIENRTEIGLSSISPYVITALLAVEDKRFFEHSGIDLRSWLRAFKGVATNQAGMGGGSTLSQQLAKNLYPRKNYFIPGLSILINKIRENIISIKLENIYDKEELLALYLNTVPFGGDRYGINVASRYFYNKKAVELNAAEAATLIGMLKATTALDPTRNPKNSQKRRNLVLSRMVENSSFTFHDADLKTVSSLIANGKLSREEFEKIKDKPVNARRYTGADGTEGVGAYFREYLRINEMPRILQGLTKEDGTKYNLYRDGLKIYTTLDSRMQAFAEKAVQKHMSELQGRFYKHWKDYKEEKPWGDDKWLEEQKLRSERYLKLKENEVPDSLIEKSFNEPVKMTVFTWKNGGGDTDTIMSPMDSIKHYFLMLNTGFMAMDHSNGHIKAWVGGTDFKYFKYDHILSKRQVGSTFKPIVYAAAVKDSVKPCDFFYNEKVTLEDWSPDNSDGVYGDWVTTAGGLAYSINTIAAKLIERVGIQRTIDMATAMGITTPLPREFGISLGAADIMLYDMMKVYGTFANKGVRPEPIAVIKVTDRNGNVIYDAAQAMKAKFPGRDTTHVISEEQASIMTRMLQNVIDRGTGSKFRNAYGIVGEFAGKTGTTQNHSDGWFITFNPTLVTGAWVGGPSPAVRFRDMNQGQGSAMALPIVGEFWKQIRSDNQLKKLTDTRFEMEDTIRTFFNCPLRIPVHPDSMAVLMQDSTLRDSILKNGFRGISDMLKERFGTPGEGMEEFLDENGEILEGLPEDPTQPTEEKKQEDKKIQNEGTLPPGDKKKQDIKKTPPKKPGDGGR